MDLAEAPIALILAGITAYAVLGGADFGAGLWYMLLPGERRRHLRDHTYHAMGPVWEANHVWLIYVLVVAWTAYPRAFGSIFSTLYVPLFVAAIGIILRGATYALRGQVTRARDERLLGAIFGGSSLLTPFALGAVVGAIASGRVPVGNAAGEPFGSWLTPTSMLVGALTVVTSAYLAAVWLTADAARAGRDDLVAAFRARALVMGVAAGVLAVAGLVVLNSDAERTFHGLTSGAGLAAVIVSGVAGAATMLLVVRSRFELARQSAALAVAAVIAGWAFAQRPDLLPGLSVQEGAAGDAVIVAILVSTALGAVILVPSLAFLFGLVLRGRFDDRPQEPGSLIRVPDEPAAPPRSGPSPPHVPLAAFVVSAVLGLPLTVLSDGGVGLAAGVLLLMSALVAAAALLLPLAAEGTAEGRSGNL
jgi:cytochrome d ubiquinol oxidase subunit II